MYTYQDCKTGVERLQKHLNFMRKLPEDRYDHDTWHKPDCETPSCNLGWCREVFPNHFLNFRLTEPPTDIDGQTHMATGKNLFKISDAMKHYLFNFYVPVDIDDISCDITDYAGQNHFLPHDGQLSTTIKRLELVLNYMRRRLAIMEVENNLDWFDIPVGKAREEYLTNSLS